MKTWKQRAAEARAAGYRPGNGWEGMLRRQLKLTSPNLLKELNRAGEFRAYLQVMVAQALSLQAYLEQQGSPPETAREVALEGLLAAGQEEAPEAWEMEEAAQSMIAAASQVLPRLAAPSSNAPPAPNTPPT